MLKCITIIILSTLLSSLTLQAQMSSEDSLKLAILQLDHKVEDIQLHIDQGQKQFKTGIIVSTIGYSVTIAGGLMLGRDNDSIGQALLIAGGATGLTGTFLMADAFAVMAGKKKKRKSK